MTTDNNAEVHALREVIAAFRTVGSQTQSTDNAAQAAREAADQAANAAQAARDAAQRAAEAAQAANNAAQAARDATSTVIASSAATVSALNSATNALIRLEAAMVNRRCPHCGQLIAA